MIWPIWRTSRRHSSNTCSATWGYMGREILYVFTNNAHPFEEGRGYRLPNLWVMLEHGGDWAKALNVALKHNNLAAADAVAEQRTQMMVEFLTGVTQ